MKKCLLTYDQFEGSGEHSEKGLKKLNVKLKNLKIFPYDQIEQMREVQAFAGKLSIQGVQPKLSAKLSVKDEEFQLTDVGGTYILKPQVASYEQLPENEDLTMHLAELAKMSVPWHGLLRAKDSSLLYVVKRFDRLGKGKKLLQEDFAQLLQATRSTKYQANMEKVAGLVEEFCTFPSLELPKLFKLIVFSFVVGNEDLHLKNISIQTSLDGTVKLSPAYDLVNTTIIMPTQEELALELNDKKRNLKRIDFIEYYAVTQLGLSKKIAEKVVNDLLDLIPTFEEWVDKSFLNEEMKKKYKEVLNSRSNALK